MPPAPSARVLRHLASRRIPQLLDTMIPEVRVPTQAGRVWSALAETTCQHVSFHHPSGCASGF